MPFSKRSWLLLTISILSILTSCQRNNGLLPDTHAQAGNINPSPVNASIQGSVFDQSNNPVTGATVKAGGNVTTTDSRGLFRFNHINIDKYASVITVEANGFFKGIRTFSAKDGSTNYVKLKLLTKNFVGTVDAVTGGTVTLPGNAQVIISTNSIVVKSTGAAYTGPVRIYAANIDPTADDIAEIIPGSLQANDSNNYRVILKSFGMVAIQLEGATGEQLQIASGQTARLLVTIPPSLVATAPTTLPLWYMDETEGLWKQQGNATKTGNYYEGNVSHFSFWNCDAGANTIFFEVTLNCANGTSYANGPLPNTLVKLTSLTSGFISWGTTDSTGHVGGLVFTNDILKLEVINDCYETIYTQNIGPFTQNTNIGTILLPASTPGTVEITGNAVDCNNQPVNNATALIYYGGQQVLTPVLNGQFHVNLIRCTSSTVPVEVLIFDYVNNQQSNTWTGNTSSGTINTGTLTVCGALAEQFVNYVVDGVNYNFVSSNPGDSIYADPTISQTTQIWAFKSTGPSDTTLLFHFSGGYTVGSRTMLVVYVNTMNHIASVNPSVINVTAYGTTMGSFIEANFNGLFIDNSTAITHSISGSLRARRNF